MLIPAIIHLALSIFLVKKLWTTANVSKGEKILSSFMILIPLFGTAYYFINYNRPRSETPSHLHAKETTGINTHSDHYWRYDQSEDLKSDNLKNNK